MGVCWPLVSQRRQQPALPVRLADSQVLPSPVQLVKLQLHRRPARVSVCGKPGLVFCGDGGSVLGSPVGSMRYGRNWSFAVRTISALRTPMKSAPCKPNWSFATLPGKLVQWRRQSQRFRRLLRLRRPLVNPPGDGVARVTVAPTRLRLLPAGRLAFRLAAGALPASYSRIRPEPPAADSYMVSSGPLAS